MSTQPFIKWFADTTIEDIPIVGGKNASLGELFRELGGRGVRIPNGFSITAGGYRHFIREAELDPVIRAAFSGLDTRDVSNLAERATAVRRAILDASLPADLQMEIATAYQQLQGTGASAPAVAVRSDLACSGVMFTIDTETGFRDAVLVSAAYGLGENVVQGFVTPDEYTIFKPTRKGGFRPILRKSPGFSSSRPVPRPCSPARISTCLKPISSERAVGSATAPCPVDHRWPDIPRINPIFGKFPVEQSERTQHPTKYGRKH